MGIATVAKAVAGFLGQHPDGESLPFRSFRHLLMQISLEQGCSLFRTDFFKLKNGIVLPFEENDPAWFTAFRSGDTHDMNRIEAEGGLAFP
jgi:hypothetical protein